MKINYRGWTIGLSLVGFKYPNYQYNTDKKAKPIWQVRINGSKNPETDLGNPQEVLDKWKKFIDVRIDDPDKIYWF